MTALSERVGREDIVKAISGVLGTMADKRTDLLTIPRNKRKHFKDTGVMFSYGYKGDEAKILFSFFVPGITKNRKPVIVGVLFDIDDFHDGPQGYVLGMVQKAKAGIAQAKEQADGLQLAASNGDLIDRFK